MSCTEIIFNKKCILVNGIEIKLPPKELAFYLWLSQQPERRINITRQFCADTKYSASYLKMYSMVSSDSRVFTSFNVDREMVEQCSAETLSKLTDIRPFEKDWLQQIRSKMDVFLPLDSEIICKIGDKTKGGVDVIARMKE